MELMEVRKSYIGTSKLPNQSIFWKFLELNGTLKGELPMTESCSVDG